MTPVQRPEPVFVTWCLRVAGLISGAYILIYANEAYRTLNYPFILDWPEANLFIPVLRLRDGLPLYSAPDPAYVANLYTPLFYYFAEAVSWVTGPHLIAGRLVSLASTLAIVCLTYCWLRKEGASRMLGFAAVGCFFGISNLTGHWFNMGRPDCLFIAFLVAGSYIIRFYPSLRGNLLAALLLSLSFLSKQSALIAILPLLGFLWLTAPRRGLLVTAIMAFLCGSAIVLWNYQSDGWFNFFVFTMAKSHPFAGAMLTVFWIKELVFFWPGMVLTCAEFRRLRHSDRHLLFFYAALVSGYVLISCIGELHAGGFVNVDIPADYILILMAALCIAHASKDEAKRKERNFHCVCLVWQLCNLVYDPTWIIPTAADEEAGNKMVRYIASVQGDVLIPDFGYYQVYAGKPSYGWGSAGWDIMRMNKPNPVKDDFIRSINDALDSEKFAAIILSNLDVKPYVFKDNPHFDQHYCFKETLFSGKVFLPQGGGWKIRPERVYVPCAKQ